MPTFADQPLLLPGRFAHITETWQPAGRPTARVILIQDIHAHPEAQAHISELVDRLSSRYGIRTFALEGGQGRCAPERFSQAGDADAVGRAAQTFLEQALFTGAEHFAVTHPDRVELLGIEDPALYREQLMVFRQALDARQKPLQQLASLRSALEDKRLEIFPEPLRALAALKRRAESADNECVPYLSELIRLAEDRAIPLDRYSNIRRLIENQRLAESFDSAKVADEAKAFGAHLWPSLSSEEKEQLTKLMQAISGSEADATDFYRALSNLAQAHGLSCSRWPVLSVYLTWLGRNDQVSLADIPRETESLEEAVENAHLASEPQCVLASLIRRVGAIEALVGARLSPRGLDAYQRIRPSLSADGFWRDLRIILGEPPMSREAIDALFEGLALYERFYVLARQRDDALAVRILSSLEKESTLAVVVGGFHTSGITARLREAGIAYAVVTPAITAPIDERLYLVRIRGELPSQQTLLARAAQALAPELVTHPATNGYTSAQQIFVHTVQSLAAPPRDSKSVSYAQEIGPLILSEGESARIAVDVKAMPGVQPGELSVKILRHARPLENWAERWPHTVLEEDMEYESRNEDGSFRFIWDGGVLEQGKYEYQIIAKRKRDRDGAKLVSVHRIVVRPASNAPNVREFLRSATGIAGRLIYPASGRDMTRPLNLAALLPDITEVLLVDLAYPNPYKNGTPEVVNDLVPFIANDKREALFWERIEEVSRSLLDAFSKISGDKGVQLDKRTEQIERNEARVEFSIRSGETGRRLTVRLLAQDYRKFDDGPFFLTLIRQPGGAGWLSENKAFWLRLMEQAELGGYIIVSGSAFPDFILQHLSEWGLRIAHRDPDRPLFNTTTLTAGELVLQKVAQSSRVASLDTKKVAFLLSIVAPLLWLMLVIHMLIALPGISHDARQLESDLCRAGYVLYMRYKRGAHSSLSAVAPTRGGKLHGTVSTIADSIRQITDEIKDLPIRVRATITAVLAMQSQKKGVLEFQVFKEPESLLVDGRNRSIPLSHRLGLYLGILRLNSGLSLLQVLWTGEKIVAKAQANGFLGPAVAHLFVQESRRKFVYTNGNSSTVSEPVHISRDRILKDLKAQLKPALGEAGLSRLNISVHVEPGKDTLKNFLLIRVVGRFPAGGGSLQRFFVRSYAQRRELADAIASWIAYESVILRERTLDEQPLFGKNWTGDSQTIATILHILNLIGADIEKAPSKRYRLPLQRQVELLIEMIEQGRRIPRNTLMSRWQIQRFTVDEVEEDLTERLKQDTPIASLDHLVRWIYVTENPQPSNPVDAVRHALDLQVRLREINLNEKRFVEHYLDNGFIVPRVYFELLNEAQNIPVGIARFQTVILGLLTELKSYDNFQKWSIRSQFDPTDAKHKVNLQRLDAFVHSNEQNVFPGDDLIHRACAIQSAVDDIHEHAQALDHSLQVFKRSSRYLKTRTRHRQRLFHRITVLSQKIEVLKAYERRGMLPRALEACRKGAQAVISRVQMILEEDLGPHTQLTQHQAVLDLDQSATELNALIALSNTVQTQPQFEYVAKLLQDALVRAQAILEQSRIIRDQNTSIAQLPLLEETFARMESLMASAQQLLDSPRLPIEDDTSQLPLEESATNALWRAWEMKQSNISIEPSVFTVAVDALERLQERGDRFAFLVILLTVTEVRLFRPDIVCAQRLKCDFSTVQKARERAEKTLNEVSAGGISSLDAFFDRVYESVSGEPLNHIQLLEQRIERLERSARRHTRFRFFDAQHFAILAYLHDFRYALPFPDNRLKDKPEFPEQTDEYFRTEMGIAVDYLWRELEESNEWKSWLAKHSEFENAEDRHRRQQAIVAFIHESDTSTSLCPSLKNILAARSAQRPPYELWRLPARMNVHHEAWKWSRIRRDETQSDARIEAYPFWQAWLGDSFQPEILRVLVEILDSLVEDTNAFLIIYWLATERVLPKTNTVYGRRLGIARNSVPFLMNRVAAVLETSGLPVKATERGRRLDNVLLALNSALASPLSDRSDQKFPQMESLSGDVLPERPVLEIPTTDLALTAKSN